MKKFSAEYKEYAYRLIAEWDEFIPAAREMLQAVLTILYFFFCLIVRLLLIVTLPISAAVIVHFSLKEAKKNEDIRAKLRAGIHRNGA